MDDRSFTSCYTSLNLWEPTLHIIESEVNFVLRINNKNLKYLFKHIITYSGRYYATINKPNPQTIIDVFLIKQTYSVNSNLTDWFVSVRA